MASQYMLDRVAALRGLADDLKKDGRPADAAVCIECARALDTMIDALDRCAERARERRAEEA